MMRRLAVVIACMALAASGCSMRRPAKSLPAADPPPRSIVAPQPVPPPPPLGDLEIAEANSALRAGNRSAAAEKLESILEMGVRAPSRDEALFTLAVIEAYPDNPARDVSRARGLLNEIIQSGKSPARSHAAGLILSILAVEEEQTKEVADLRSQIEASKGEMEGLKAALARREAELKKIKEILLETHPGA